MTYDLSEQDRACLNHFTERMQERSEHFIGYPSATDLDYSELYPLLRYRLNNIGDPMVGSTSQLNSRMFEREVLNFFAQLFQAPPQNWWGYVTNGGSEGNLYSLYLSRELYPDGIVYYSEATHYSVQKNIQLLNLRSIVIRQQENGEIDYDDLQQMLMQHRDKPAIIIANIGTTMTEAIDDIPHIKGILQQLAIKSCYIHADGALAGIYAALLNSGKPFDFAAGADSIAISGHKFLGVPIPCGVVLVKKNYKERIGKAIPYIGTVDTTITGSRNGHSPVFLWYALRKLGKEGMRQRALASLDLAAYTLQQLQELGVHAWRNEGAITVVFEAPSEKLRMQWQLATDGEWSHIICMPGVTKAQIDDFIDDLRNDLQTPGIHTSPLLHAN